MPFHFWLWKWQWCTFVTYFSHFIIFFSKKVEIYSTFFFSLFQSTPCKHPVIVLQDVAFTDLHALVEFIYHGEVNVHQRSLSSFLKTAEVLRVSGLTQQQAEETHNVCQQCNPLMINNNFCEFTVSSSTKFGTNRRSHSNKSSSELYW